MTSTAAKILAEQNGLADANPGEVAPAEAAIPDRVMSMVNFVRDHAASHLDAGWDVVIETLTLEEIAAKIKRARTVTGAVNIIRDTVVEPWVRGLVESRPGSDDDEQLAIGRRFEAERTANWADATAFREGRENKSKAPRKGRMPVVTEAAVPAQRSGRAAPETETEEAPAKPKPKPAARKRAPRRAAAK